MSEAQGVLEFKRPKTGWRPPSELPEFGENEKLAWDFESTGKNPFEDEPVGLAVYSGERRRGWYLPWGHRGGGNLDKKTVLRWAKEQLRKKSLTGVNGKFECHMSRTFGLDLDQMQIKPRDVAFNAALLNENRYSGFSLEALAKEYLPEHLRKVHPCAVDPDKFYLASAGEIAPRAISDCELAWEIDQVTSKQITAEGLDRVLDVENAIILPVTEMEHNGARLDVEKLGRWRKEIQEKINTSFFALHHALGFPVNPDSPDDMRKMFGKLSLPYPKQWEEDPEQKGKMIEAESFSAAALKTVDNALVRDALRLRRLKSIKSKYLDKYARAVDSKGVIRYHLHQLRADEFGTVSGRFSCGGGEHAINIQQVMKVEKQIEKFGDEFIVRELFIPADGRYFFASDASQIEFRLFAHYANSLRLIDEYAKNPMADFHTIVQQMISLVVEISRWAAKNINFGKLYGMGLAKLCATLQLSETEGKKLIANYEEAFPEAPRLLQTASRLAKERKFVKTFLGRRRRFPDGKKLHSALNCVLQGTAADVFKVKLRELFDARFDLGLTLRMPVHDEFAGDIEERENLPRLRTLLDTQSLVFRVPLLWETKIGLNWRELTSNYDEVRILDGPHTKGEER